jgi:predicted 2-oxoglutarate/Fe(II)-dependent dioxygenase YbiX
MNTRFTLIKENFLTPEECKGFIDFSEKQGYGEALVRIKGGGEEIRKDIRDNDRVIWDNAQVASQLYEQIKDLLPDVDGYEPTGLNERFRFYRYKDGQQFKPHVDGSYKKSPTEESKVTLLLYLNDNFEGGSTTLIMEGQEIVPKEGMMLLFAHKIMHCGRPVTAGTKYVLRTDVMYKLKEYKNL